MSLEDKQEEIVAMAFYNKQAHEKEVIKGIEACILFYDENYKRIEGFEMNNGIWKTSTSKLTINKTSNNGNTAIATNNFDDNGCETWGCFLCTLWCKWTS